MTDQIKRIIKDAGKAILEVYATDFDIDHKENQSPLTLADRRSHEIIRDRLKSLQPDIPFLSEEGTEIPYHERKSWKRYWLVDPLDGTKEFVKRNGEFTVNIALIEREKPVFGMVYCPIKDLLYYTDQDKSYRQEGDRNPEQLPCRTHEGTIVVTSRSHLNKETTKYVEALGEVRLIQAGSSLKLCLVAEGSADIYPRLGPTMEWDTAAAHAIVRYAGKGVFRADNNSELTYNKEDLHNPWFVVK